MIAARRSDQLGGHATTTRHGTNRVGPDDLADLDYLSGTSDASDVNHQIDRGRDLLANGDMGDAIAGRQGECLDAPQTHRADRWRGPWRGNRRGRC